MALEREYKWLVSEPFPTVGALRPVLAGCGVDLVPQGERQQEDLYYDLPGGALRLQGVALRVRRFGDQTLATLKLPGRVQGSFHEREELELPLVAPPNTAAPPPEGVGWPEPIRERLMALGALDLGALAPLLALSTHRRRMGLQRGAVPVAELSFDTVRARRPSAPLEGPGPERVQFRELELEAHPGTPAETLEGVAEALAARFALEPHTQDKVTHALRLLLGGAPR